MTTATNNSIRSILKAMHQPDAGHYGACVFCQHGRTQGDDQRCSRPGHPDMPTEQARARSGHCGPDAHGMQFYHPTRRPGQASLAL